VTALHVRYVRTPRSRSTLAIVIALALLAGACASDSDPPQSADTTSTTVEADDQDPTSTTVLEIGEPAPPQHDIRIGVLDNGLTYYVQSNDSPGGSVSMRLVVDAGAVQEEPIGTGVAHFLEHMMFNGTERYPGNTLEDVLREIGSPIGADSNAFTSQTETVYQLTVQDTGDRVDIAMGILREWAGNALIDPIEVAAEAPVVREEIRSDESGQGIIGVEFEQAYALATPFEGVNVSGTATSINATTPEELRAFYETWYVPENMAVVVVGDRNIDALEFLVVERFSDLDGRQTGSAQPVLSDYELPQDPYVAVIIEPSFGDSFVSVDIPLKAWDSNTRGGQELQLTEVLLGLMIDDRLSEGVDTGRLDLRRGGGGRFRWNRYQPFIGFNVDADNLESGTEVLMTELTGSLQNPFTEAELSRAVDIYRSIVEQRLAEIGSVQDRDLADVLVGHFLGGADIQAIDESVAMNLDILDSLEIEAANNHWGWMLTGGAPLVIAVGPDAERVGEVDDYVRAVERARTANVAGFDDDFVPIDVLVDPPESVEEIDTNGLSANSGLELVFGNGMRVLFSNSTISDGQVSVVSRSPGGADELSAPDALLASVALNSVAASGVGPWSRVQLRRFLSDLDVSGAPYIDTSVEGFSGGASTQDLEVLFQLFYLLATEPQVDPVAFAQQVEFARDATTESGLDGSRAATLALVSARLGVDSVLPSIADLDAFTADDALEIYSDRFTRLDDQVVVVVGDVDEETVVDLARRYIGSLPTPAADQEPEGRPGPGVVEQRLDVGSGTASGAFRLMTLGQVNESVSNRVLAQLTESILNDRLFTVIREELGATYQGFASITFDDPGDLAALFISADGDPARIDEIADAVFVELSTIRDGGLTSADFSEAVTILESRYNFINNGFIIESLFDESDSRGRGVIGRGVQLEELAKITPGDVADFVEVLFSTDNRIDIRNIP